MQDQTVITLAAIIAMTILGSVYFFFIRQDGTIFSALAILVATLGGYHVGRGSRNGPGG